MGMLWTVRQLWLYGARFVFNCYCRHSSLVLRRGDGTDNILHSKEYVAQGDPMAMVAYGIVILPLIKHLKSTYPDVTQPWYGDSSGSRGTFDHLEKYFKALNGNSPARGYLTNPTKIILAEHPQNPE